MTDISGVRVIVHYLDEVPAIEDLIEREFKIDWKNSIDKSKLLKPNQFGYLSVQYIVSLPAQRLTTENQEFRGLKGEIQVRTLPQHVWAAISHQLEYKKESEIPYPLQRKLFRMAAQLELVDEQFQALRDEVTRIVETYPQTEVSAWTLPAFCRSSAKMREIEAHAEHVGFSSGIDNKAIATELSEACEKTGVATLAELETALGRLADKSRPFLQANATEIRTATKRQGGLQAGPMTLILMLMYAHHPETFTRQYLRTRRWTRRAIDSLLEAAKKSKFPRASD